MSGRYFIQFIQSALQKKQYEGKGLTPTMDYKGKYDLYTIYIYYKNDHIVRHFKIYYISLSEDNMVSSC